MPIRDEFVTLESRLRYRFRDRGLLEHALTHRSRAHEDVTGGVADNESLEFLGDAVLGFIIADALFQECPEMNEGQKSKIKASLVSTADARLRRRTPRTRDRICCWDAAKRRPAAAARWRCWPMRARR